MHLINWHWLEDLLVQAAESEIREFGLAHPEEAFFASCLEYEGLDGAVSMSLGSRAAVESAVARLREEAPEESIQYREVELRTENWLHREIPLLHSEHSPPAARSILEKYRENMQGEADEEVREFLWMRFEFLAESVVRRLIERGAFRYLYREPEFIAFAANEHESLEELEDRIQRFYPNYRRATAEWTDDPRVGNLRPLHCQGGRCRRHPRPRHLTRCTACGRWFCEACQEIHAHPELLLRQPFFAQE